MPIDNGTWQARVGIFFALKLVLKWKSKTREFPFLQNPVYFSLMLIFNFFRFPLNNVYHAYNCMLTEQFLKPYLYSIIKLPKITKVIAFLFLCITNLLSQCDDIETNPGPRFSSLTFCHWNLNGLTAHDSIKISLLQAYITQHNYESETFLNGSIQSDANRIKLDGYNLIRSDHPSDSKRGGVCIYYKEHIPLVKRDDICTLDHCLVTKIRSENEKSFLTCIYRSPSQKHDEFQNFCAKFDTLLTNINDEFPICSVVTGDFNARNSRWWKNGITNSACLELDSLTSSAGYTQIMDKQTHAANSSMSCIDLVFCTNLNVISKHGVDVIIFDKCHHDIIYGKINIRVPLPPTYVREVWDYRKANVDNIKKAISNFNWNKAFENLAIDEKVALLNQTLLNIFRNYILNKKIKYDYRQPPWMTNKTKILLKERSKLTKYFYRNGHRESDRDKVLEKSAECTREILEAKRQYILKMTSKLEDAFSAPKTYWTIINHLLYSKEIPAIPPLLVDGNFVSDFNKKANFFNNFFASICTPIKNASTLPSFFL